MSLSRLALRLTALEALAPSASLTCAQWQAAHAYAVGDRFCSADPTYGELIYRVIAAGTSGVAAPSGLAADIADGAAHYAYALPRWPTLGQKSIFDTRLLPLDDLNGDDRKPTASVYTEEDHSVETGQKAGGPPFKREVALLIELAVQQLLPTGDPAAPFAAGVPFTDAECEAALDLFEAQARFALFYGPTGVLWRKLTGRRVTDIHSIPKRGAEESSPLAQRTLTVKCIIPDDDYTDTIPGQPVGLDRLPDPLNSVIGALASGSYGATLAAGLTAPAPLMPTGIPLKTVAFKLQPGAPPAAEDDSKPQINASTGDLSA